MKLMVLIRTLAFYAYMVVTVILGTTGAILALPLPAKAGVAVAGWWCRGMVWACRRICGLDCVVEGRENVPDTPSVILIKHTSMVEAFVQAAVFPNTSWVVKRELLWIPIFGWGLAAVRPIAINRQAGRRAVTQVISQGKQRLASGIWVIIFPEGTRVAPGTTRKYGISGAALARDAGVSVVPVAHNAGDYWPRHSFLKVPGTVRFCVGPPIDTRGRDPKEINALVKNWIEGKMTEISSAYAPVADESDPPEPGATAGIRG